MTEKTYESDVFHTSAGDLTLTFLGHGTLMAAFQGKTIHVDPYGRVADYSRLPKADLVLITHEHGDHLDKSALAQITKPGTQVVMTELCARQVSGGTVLRNGEHVAAAGIEVEAVPAYNIRHKRDGGQPFHPKGQGNGYVLTFGDLRVYIAGDTEDIPEMAQLHDIGCAFLPMNLPYTMTPEMVARAVRLFHPRVVYPYHFGDTDTSKLAELLRYLPDVEVRIRRMA